MSRTSWRSVASLSAMSRSVAKNLRKSRPKAYTRWHLDEMVVSLSGKQMYMWRAVDGEGEVLEILVQPRRDKVAAMRLGKRTVSHSLQALKKQGRVRIRGGQCMLPKAR